MSKTLLSGTQIRSGSIPSHALSGGIVSSSAQIFPASGSLEISGSLSIDGPENRAVLVVSGSTSIQQVMEKHIVVSSAPTSTTYYDILSQSIVYYTSNNTTDWTLHFRGNSNYSLNDVMYIGQTVTAVLLVTNGSSPYYVTSHQIDGNVVVPKWQGGNPPTEGIPNTIEAYSYSIIKTANATFTVLASKNQFA